MAHEVFISHSTQDKAVADAVCAELEGQGTGCWIAPRDVVAGSNWMQSIIQAISDCRLLVLVLSASSNKSRQVQREIELAVSKEKIIVPFRTEAVTPSGSLEYTLSTIHWLDATSPPLEQHVKSLQLSVFNLLQGNRADAAKLAASSPSSDSVAAAIVENTNPSLQPLFQMRIVEGPHKGEVFALVNTRMIVGRGRDADILLEREGAISRAHIAIQWDSVQRGFVLIDFRARNPTVINNKLVNGDELLALGDWIRFGNTIMVLEQISPAPDRESID